MKKPIGGVSEEAQGAFIVTGKINIDFFRCAIEHRKKEQGGASDSSQ
eukprot:CAMPEP_0171462572 /NCGR_PEP_ID=MMETSP0945-20130129/6555_1 /TAXON_ID=109269 /ORGANISM="Vaucheria litorea, Strain CCMP2940" /LENGTH=46 /DNA_ID= /DNA_START= /DNA_END= /DNA_ORIENTATION=